MPWAVLERQEGLLVSVWIATSAPTSRRPSCPTTGAPLTPTGRLRPARLSWTTVNRCRSLRRPPCHSRALGRPLPAPRPGWHARPPPADRITAPDGRHRTSMPWCSPCAGRIASVQPTRPCTLAARTGVAPSTAHRILARHRCGAPGGVRPGHRRTRPPLRTLPPRQAGPHRCEGSAAPPDGGRHRAPGACSGGRANRTGTGYLILHIALDDPLAYTGDPWPMRPRPPAPRSRSVPRPGSPLAALPYGVC